MEGDGGAVPEWWAENQRIRESFDLPDYDPPVFADGAYVHPVVKDLEARHECRIRILGVNTFYLDDWEVRIDDEPAFTVGRHRTDDGNTVYELTADEFTRRVEHAIDSPDTA